MNVDNYGWESSLSMVANEQTRTARPRHGVTLLRPVFMNAVEVGYSYAHCDRDKKLNVRGVTIALWHFICRGHQAIALLPYCFKNYAEKSSRYSELMMLYRLNLIEFTPGYGSEKYAEVNRIMVNRACETGGCLVARSQMQGITDNKQHLIDVVEQRLLMPTFNGDDVMFPIDGPLGRNGPSLQQTLECEQGSMDWRSCSEHQLLLSDQRHWLEKLALLVPEKVAWTRLVQVIQSGGTSEESVNADGMALFGSPEQRNSPSPPLIRSPPPQKTLTSSPISCVAPVENPFKRTSSATSPPPPAHSLRTSTSNNSFSMHSLEPMATSPLPTLNNGNQLNTWPHRPIPNPHQMNLLQRPPSVPSTTSFGTPSSRRFYRHYPHHYSHHHNHHQPHLFYGGGRHYATPRLILRYGPTDSESNDVRESMNRLKTTDSAESTVSSTRSGNEGGSEIGIGVDEEMQNSNPGSTIDMDEDVARSLTEKLEREDRQNEKRRSKSAAKQKKRDELLAKVSQIFGYPKSIRVMNKYPELNSFSLLVEKCIQEGDEEGDGSEFLEPTGVSHEPEERGNSTADDTGDVPLVPDLIDFSDAPTQPERTRQQVQQNDYSTNDPIPLVDLMS